MRCLVTLLTCGLIALSAAMGAEPPQAGTTEGPPMVVKTVPQAHDMQVDPAITEIRVTFSRPMRDQNWSWVRSYVHDYPETTGMPYYLPDAKTCVLPVKLLPATDYAVSINSEQHQNFKDLQGQPAAPYLLVFRTRSAPAQTAAPSAAGAVCDPVTGVCLLPGMEGPAAATANLSAIQKLDRGRGLLVGEGKNLAQAKTILEDAAKNQSQDLSPTDRCYLFVYLGYIEDLQGNRNAAIDWFKKGETLEGPQIQGIREVARIGLSRPVTWIRHLDASSSALSGGSSSSLPRANQAVVPLEFTLPDAYGREVRASDYRGATVLVMAGACWCGGCQQDAEVLRAIEEKYRARGLQTIRSTSLDNELPTWEFQKHYRLPSVHLIDPVREFEKRYNRDGWTFLMLANPEGKVIYRWNSPVNWPEVEQALNATLRERAEVKTVRLDGISYLPDIAQRTGETDKPRPCDRFPSLACSADGHVYVAFTTSRGGTQDVYLREFDGRKWLPDRPVAATPADEFDGTVAVDRQNRAWVAWVTNSHGPRYDIDVTCVSDPSSKIEQVTHTDDDAMHPRMAVDSAGRIWLTYYQWQKMSGRSRDKEVYTRWREDGRWSREIHVSPEDVPQYEDHTDPAIAAVGDSVAIAWSWDFHRPRGYSSVPETPSIFLRTVGPGGKLGATRAVSGANTDSRPTIAAGSDGRVWCVWESVVPDLAARAYRKMVAGSAEDLQSEEQPGIGMNISGMQTNVCTPCLSASPKGDLSLVWAEPDLKGRWTLKQAFWGADQKTWSDGKTLLSTGNPRFPSAAYASDGTLWIACSVEKGNQREIAVLSKPFARPSDQSSLVPEATTRRNNRIR